MATENPSSASTHRGPSRGRGRAPGRSRSEHPSGRIIDLTSEADSALPGSAGLVRVLLIEDDPLFAALVADILEEVGSDFVVAHAANLVTAVTRLGRVPIDLIITEIDLPDSSGAGTVGAVRAFAPLTPIVVLSETDDVLAAIDAIRQGADEYIVKGRFSIDSLVWLVRMVLERHRRPATTAGGSGGLTDSVTGLATLPALQVAGQHCLQTAERAGLHAGIAVVEIKTTRHRERVDGNHLLLAVGDTLQATLRRCDLVSRLPGEELAVLLVGRGPLDRAVDRLEAALADAGLAAQVLVGFAAYAPQDGSTTIDTLLDQARRNAHAVST